MLLSRKRSEPLAIPLHLAHSPTNVRQLSESHIRTPLRPAGRDRWCAASLTSHGYGGPEGMGSRNTADARFGVGLSGCDRCGYCINMVEPAQRFHPGQIVPISGIYRCDKDGHDHRFESTDVRGHRFPPLPGGCHGAWVLERATAHH